MRLCTEASLLLIQNARYTILLPNRRKTHHALSRRPARSWAGLEPGHLVNSI